MLSVAAGDALQAGKPGLEHKENMAVLTPDCEWEHDNGRRDPELTGAEMSLDSTYKAKDPRQQMRISLYQMFEGLREYGTSDFMETSKKLSGMLGAVVDDLESSLPELRKGSVYALGRLLDVTGQQGAELSDAVTPLLSKIIPGFIRSTANSFDSAEIEYALWGLRREIVIPYLPTHIEPLFAALLSTISTMKSKNAINKTSGGVLAGVLHLIKRLLESHKVLLEGYVQCWLSMVLPYAGHELKMVRQLSSQILELGLDQLLVHREEAHAVLASCSKELTQALAVLISGKHESAALHAISIWCILIDIMGTSLQETATLNLFVGVLNEAFSGSKPKVQCEAFRAWKKLITILSSDYLAQEKIQRLIMTPLTRSSSSDDPNSLQSRFDCWWTYIRRLGPCIVKHFAEVYRPLIEFCLCWRVDYQGHQKNRRHKNALQEAGFATLVQFLGQTHEQFDFSLETSQRNLRLPLAVFADCGKALFTATEEAFVIIKELKNQRDMFELMVQAWSKLIGYLVEYSASSVGDRLSRDLVQHSMNILRSVTHSNLFGGKSALDMLEPMTKLSAEVLSSAAYNPTHETSIHKNPALYLMEILVKPQVAMFSITDKRFARCFCSLIRVGWRCPHGSAALHILQTVVHLMSGLVHVSSDPVVYTKLWLCLSENLRLCIEKHGEVNQGDTAEGGKFDCCNKVLVYPLQHLLGNAQLQPAASKRILSSWNQLFESYCSRAVLLHNARKNGHIESLCQCICSTPLVKSGAAEIFNILKIVLSRTDFRPVDQAAEVWPIWQGKGPRSLGDLFSFVNALRLAMYALCTEYDPNQMSASSEAVTSCLFIIEKLFRSSSEVVLLDLLKELAHGMRHLLELDKSRYREECGSMWEAVCTTIIEDFRGNLSQLLEVISPLLCTTLKHPSIQLRDLSLKLWEKRFSEASHLKYSEELRKVMSAVRNMVDIQLPNFHSTDTSGEATLPPADDSHLPVHIASPHKARTPVKVKRLHTGGSLVKKEPSSPRTPAKSTASVSAIQVTPINRIVPIGASENSISIKGPAQLSTPSNVYGIKHSPKSGCLQNILSPQKLNGSSLKKEKKPGEEHILPWKKPSSAHEQSDRSKAAYITPKKTADQPSPLEAPSPLCPEEGHASSRPPSKKKLNMGSLTKEIDILPLSFNNAFLQGKATKTTAEDVYEFEETEDNPAIRCQPFTLKRRKSKDDPFSTIKNGRDGQAQNLRQLEVKSSTADTPCEEVVCSSDNDRSKPESCEIMGTALLVTVNSADILPIKPTGEALSVEEPEQASRILPETGDISGVPSETTNRMKELAPLGHCEMQLVAANERIAVPVAAESKSQRDPSTRAEGNAIQLDVVCYKENVSAPTGSDAIQAPGGIVSRCTAQAQGDSSICSGGVETVETVCCDNQAFPPAISTNPVSDSRNKGQTTFSAQPIRSFEPDEIIVLSSDEDDVKAQLLRRLASPRRTPRRRSPRKRPISQMSSLRLPPPGHSVSDKDNEDVLALPLYASSLPKRSLSTILPPPEEVVHVEPPDVTAELPFYLSQSETPRVIRSELSEMDATTPSADQSLLSLPSTPLNLQLAITPCSVKLYRLVSFHTPMSAKAEQERSRSAARGMLFDQLDKSRLLHSVSDGTLSDIERHVNNSASNQDENSVPGYGRTPTGSNIRCYSAKKKAIPKYSSVQPSHKTYAKNRDEAKEISEHGSTYTMEKSQNCQSDQAEENHMNQLTTVNLESFTPPKHVTTLDEPITTGEIIEFKERNVASPIDGSLSDSFLSTTSTILSDHSAPVFHMQTSPRNEGSSYISDDLSMAVSRDSSVFTTSSHGKIQRRQRNPHNRRRPRKDDFRFTTNNVKVIFPAVHVTFEVRVVMFPDSSARIIESVEASAQKKLRRKKQFVQTRVSNHCSAKPQCDSRTDPEDRLTKDKQTDSCDSTHSKSESSVLTSQPCIGMKDACEKPRKKKTRNRKFTGLVEKREADTVQLSDSCAKETSVLLPADQIAPVSSVTTVPAGVSANTTHYCSLTIETESNQLFDEISLGDQLMRGQLPHTCNQAAIVPASIDPTVGIVDTVFNEFTPIVQDAESMDVEPWPQPSRILVVEESCPSPSHTAADNGLDDTRPAASSSPDPKKLPPTHIDGSSVAVNTSPIVKKLNLENSRSALMLSRSLSGGSGKASQSTVKDSNMVDVNTLVATPKSQRTQSLEISSPGISPSGSILKRKSWHRAENSPRPKRVKFSIPGDASRKGPENHEPTDTSPTDTSQRVDGSQETSSSLVSLEPDSVTNYKGTPPDLDNCSPIAVDFIDSLEPIDDMLPYLTSSAWLADLKAHLLGLGLHTVGDIANLTEVKVNALPIKAPKVPSVLRAFRKVAAIAAKRKRKSARDAEAQRKLIQAIVSDAALSAEDACAQVLGTFHKT